MLLIADLARHYPARFRTVAAPSDYAALETMIGELNGKQPGASARPRPPHGVDMMAMTSSQAQSPLEAPAIAAAHAPLFSEPEVVEAVVVPDLDPAKTAAVFQSPF